MSKSYAISDVENIKDKSSHYLLTAEWSSVGVEDLDFSIASFLFSHSKLA
jgi:hypothetical protein